MGLCQYVVCIAVATIYLIMVKTIRPVVPAACALCVFKVMLSISTVIDFHRSSQQLKRPQSRVNESAPHNVSQLNEL